MHAPTIARFFTLLMLLMLPGAVRAQTCNIQTFPGSVNFTAGAGVTTLTFNAQAVLVGLAAPPMPITSVVSSISGVTATLVSGGFEVMVTVTSFPTTLGVTMASLTLSAACGATLVVPMNLTVLPCVPEISPSSWSPSVVAGGPAVTQVFQVTNTYPGGLPGAGLWTVTGAPPGVSAAITSQTVGQATLQVSAGANVPTSTAQLQLTSSCGQGSALITVSILGCPPSSPGWSVAIKPNAAPTANLFQLSPAGATMAGIWSLPAVPPELTLAISFQTSSSCIVSASATSAAAPSPYSLDLQWSGTCGGNPFTLTIPIRVLVVFDAPILPSGASNWISRHADERNSRRAESQYPQDDLEEMWRLPLNPNLEVDGDVLVADGVVVARVHPGEPTRFSAVGLRNGRTLWSRTVDPTFADRYRAGCIVADRVFIPTSANGSTVSSLAGHRQKVHAFDLLTGQPAGIWDSTITGTISSLQALPDQDAVAFTLMDYVPVCTGANFRLAVLDASLASTQMSAPRTDPLNLDYAPPTLAGGGIFSHTYGLACGQAASWKSKALRRYDPISVAENDASPLSGQSVSSTPFTVGYSPLVSDGTGFGALFDTGGRLRYFDVQAGLTELWSVPAATAAAPLPRLLHPNMLDYVIVLADEFGGRISAWLRLDGSPLWELSVAAGTLVAAPRAHSDVVLANDVLMLTLANGGIYTLDATGALTPTMPLSQNADYAIPVDGHVLVREGLELVCYGKPRPRPEGPCISLDGAQPGDELGTFICAPGDLDGDGIPDFALGAPGDDTQAIDGGAVIVYSGSDLSILRTHVGQIAGGLLGRSLGAIGDLDGDGVSEYIAGAPATDTDVGTGRAFVYSGATGQTLHTFVGDDVGDNFGEAVSGAGDVDADGTPDLVIGADRDDDQGQFAGRARVYSGADFSVLYSFDGDDAHDRLGIAVGSAGDVDGDGHDDILVGASFDDDAGLDSGSARVYSGADGALLHYFTGAGAGDYFGITLASAGDLDGDGRPDILVGIDEFGGPGYARAFSGANGSLLLELTGPSPGAYFGSSVAAGGDFDGDGVPDLVIGAPHVVNDGRETGAATIFSGATGLPVTTLFGHDHGDRLGHEVAMIGDLDGDGRTEIVIGAPQADHAGVDAGSALVVFSSTPTCTTSYLGSGEDLVLRVGINGSPRRYPDVTPGHAGDTISIQLLSPAGTFTGLLPVLVVQFFPTGSPYPSPFGFPELHVNDSFAPVAPVLLFDNDPQHATFGQYVLPASGIYLTSPLIGGLEGTSIMLQGLSIAGAAAENGFFAATDGHEIPVLP